MPFWITPQTILAFNLWLYYGVEFKCGAYELYKINGIAIQDHSLTQINWKYCSYNAVTALFAFLGLHLLCFMESLIVSERFERLLNESDIGEIDMPVFLKARRLLGLTDNFELAYNNISDYSS